MPPREPSLPEGTDHIIDTNIDLGATGGGSSGANRADAAGTEGTDTDGEKSDAGKDDGTKVAFQFDKQDDGANAAASGIIGTVKEQISTLKGQATDKARTYADDGKGKATDLLKTLADIVSDASGSVEDKLGGQYAGFGHKASDSIQSLASTLDGKSVDDIVQDARAFVQKSPVVAIGIAALIGFAVARVVRSSVSEYRGGGGADGDPA